MDNQFIPQLADCITSSNLIGAKAFYMRKLKEDPDEIAQLIYHTLPIALQLYERHHERPRRLSAIVTAVHVTNYLHDIRHKDDIAALT